MSGATILVVDDDQDIRDLLALVLDLNGYCAIPGVDGVDAMEKLDHGPRPAAILVDIMMPRMNGIEFVNALHRNAKLASIPVIILSGDAAAHTTADALAAQACLTKPVDLDQLLATVEAVTTTPAVRGRES